MRALHVVGVDLELRLGVDLGVAREQQVAVGLVGLGLLRVRVHVHPPVEHPAPAPAGDALVVLAACAVRRHVLDVGVEVGVLASVRHVEPVEGAARVLAVEGDVDVVAREPGPERHREGVERGAAREPRFECGDVVCGGPRLLHLVVLDGGVPGHVDLGDHVVEIHGAFDPGEVLDHGDARPRLRHDHDAGGVRALALLRAGHEHEVHGGVGDRPRGGPDHRAGVHERGVERGERALLRAHDPREPVLEERGVACEGAGEVLGGDSG